MAEAEIAIHVILPIIVGFIIGIIEAYFVYEDEASGGLNGFFGKVWHGIIFSIIGVIVVMNVPWILSMISLPGWISGLLFLNETTGVSLTVSILVFIIMFVKIDMAHRIKGVGGRGFVEKPWHKLVVALLIGFAPYYIIPMYGLDFIKNLSIPFL